MSDTDTTIQLPERSTAYWLNTLPADAVIYELVKGKQDIQYVYRCTWTNLPLRNAFAIPGECMTGRKNSCITLHGRFRDLACLYSWVMANKVALGKERCNRIVAWLYKEGGDQLFKTITPDVKLLQVNTGHLNETDWSNLYMADNRVLQATFLRPHIFADAEHRLRQVHAREQKELRNSSTTKQMDSAELDILTRDLNVTQQYLANAGQTQDQPTSQIMSAQDAKATIPSTPTTKSKPESHQKRKMDIDAKKSVAKKPKAPEGGSFMEFLAQQQKSAVVPVAAANGVAAPAAPKKKKRAPAAAAAAPKSDEDAQMALLRKMYADMQKGEKAAAAAPASASSSSVSKVPTQNRPITLHKGNKKEEIASKDWYHDVTKLVVSDERFNSTDAVKVAIMVIDKKGVARIFPLFGNYEASVNLV